ncbi:MAG: hypothetical protein IMZ57_06935 [Acidobacteria bacterium]|nr:hypothetical protein [Acidobacteriota bacterium]
MMEKKSFILVAIIITVLSVGSMLGVRYLGHKKPITSNFAHEAGAILINLDNESKRNISLYESAILKLEDGTYRIIGAGFEPEEEKLFVEKRLSARKIDFVIEDPLVLERRIMVAEAYKTLNNAEKRCYADGFGSIIFRNGFYYFYCDSVKYRDYVLKYGTECKSCEELKKAKSN